MAGVEVDCVRDEVVCARDETVRQFVYIQAKR
jgi:hypothetical protein